MRILFAKRRWSAVPELLGEAGVAIETDFSEEIGPSVLRSRHHRQNVLLSQCCHTAALLRMQARCDWSYLLLAIQNMDLGGYVIFTLSALRS